MAITKIATVTVGVLGAASIDFTSIPGTFTDLILEVSMRTSNSGTQDDPIYRFNSDSVSGHYSYRFLYGTGSAAASANNTSTTFNYLGNCPSLTATSNTFGNTIVTIPNYAGSTTKSSSVDFVAENNATTSYQGIIANLWNQTSAINSISITSSTSSTIAQYSTATLYGVTKGSLAGVTVS